MAAVAVKQLNYELDVVHKMGFEDYFLIVGQLVPYKRFDLAIQVFNQLKYPLVVVGVNSIAIYCMGMLLRGWTIQTWKTHLGQDFFLSWGTLNQPAMEAIFAGLFFWLACWWMYRQRIFVRI